MNKTIAWAVIVEGRLHDAFTHQADAFDAGFATAARFELLPLVAAPAIPETAQAQLHRIGDLPLSEGQSGSLSLPLGALARHTQADDPQAIELQSARDMLEDAHSELNMIRRALNVPYEPHQCLLERTMDAARSAGALTQAARDVLAERQRQISAEGYTPGHDDDHVCEEIAAMASFYLMPQGARDWDASSTGYGDTLGEALAPRGWYKPSPCDRRRELVKGVALGLAEIERFDRAAASAEEGGRNAQT